jgi:hypothetical protein
MKLEEKLDWKRLIVTIVSIDLLNYKRNCHRFQIDSLEATSSLANQEISSYQENRMFIAMFIKVRQ